jgi:glycine/D-amino acid oxidase-like deaminating enzyme
VSTAMIQDAEAVVVGAGALGASVAYHLARLGKRPIALVDKYELASQSSPRAAGLTSQVRATEFMSRLAMRSVRAIERFAAETGEPMIYHQTGSLKIARTPDDEAQLRRDVERGRRLGIDIEHISLSEARGLLPYLETAGIRAISYTGSDLYLEPAQLPLGYARAAERLGTSLLPNTAVTCIGTQAGAVEQVVTDRGVIRTPILVDTAGAWTRMVGHMAGVDIPVVPTRHQLLITEPIPGVAASQPIARIIDANVYIRPDNGGLMLGGYETNPVQYDMGDVPPNFQIKDLVLDLTVLKRLAESVAPQFPAFRHLAVREHRGGLPTMTGDGRHVIGPVPGVKGLFVASGCCVGGLSTSPALGEGLAELIVSGQPPEDLKPLAPDRFGPEYRSDEWLRAESRMRYSRHYYYPSR